MCNNFSFEEIVEVAVISTSKLYYLNLKELTVASHEGKLFIYKDLNRGELVNQKIREEIIFRIKLMTRLLKMKIPTKYLKKIEISSHERLALVEKWQKWEGECSCLRRYVQL